MSLPSSSSSFKEEETESRRGEVHLEDDINPDDIIKIFLATDVHLGYKESDSIIGRYKQFTPITKNYQSYLL